jgi:hypothetical protein
MEKLESFLSADENDAFKKDKTEAKQGKSNRSTMDDIRSNPKNIELAKLYEDAWEYEQELAAFEAELEVVNAHTTEELAAALTSAFPKEDRDFETELHGILVATWTHKVEVKQSHPQEQLDLIKKSTLNDVAEQLKAAFADYDGDFDKEVKAAFVDRLKTLIEIKKEHIKEETTDMKIAGLKPSFVKRIYKQVHGIK